MKVTDMPELLQLSISEKIIFLEELWDSISSLNNEIPIPISHKNELDKRHEKYLKSPGELLSMDELQSRIEKRK